MNGCKYFNTKYCFNNVQLTPFVDCCVALLQRQDVLTGPVAQSKVVSALLTFTEGSNQARSRQVVCVLLESFVKNIL